MSDEGGEVAMCNTDNGAGVALLLRAEADRAEKGLCGRMKVGDKERGERERTQRCSQQILQQ
jgi:hypothetical protein